MISKKLWISCICVPIILILIGLAGCDTTASTNHATAVPVITTAITGISSTTSTSTAAITSYSIFPTTFSTTTKLLTKTPTTITVTPGVTFDSPGGEYLWPITVGPYGDLWFTDANGNTIDKISVTGKMTEYDVPTAGAGPNGITTGPDGNLWLQKHRPTKLVKSRQRQAPLLNIMCLQIQLVLTELLLVLMETYGSLKPLVKSVRFLQ